jgi:hypothetical protein
MVVMLYLDCSILDGCLIDSAPIESIQHRLNVSHIYKILSRAH